MLDLSVFAEKVWEVKLLDETVLQVKRPSNALLIQLEAFMVKGTPDAIEEAIKEISEVTFKILNNNKNDRAFKLVDIKKLDVDLQTAIIRGYSNFARECMQGKN